MANYTLLGTQKYVSALCVDCPTRFVLKTQALLWLDSVREFLLRQHLTVKSTWGLVWERGVCAERICKHSWVRTVSNVIISGLFPHYALLAALHFHLDIPKITISMAGLTDSHIIPHLNMYKINASSHSQQCLNGDTTTWLSTLHLPDSIKKANTKL